MADALSVNELIKCWSILPCQS